MKTTYIGIGSNLGDKHLNCLRAVEMIKRISGCELNGLSDWYMTRPVGVKQQDWYVNGVAFITTSLLPQHLLSKLLAIEADMGRVRRRQWASRIIDLDILLFGREIINNEDLTVPHPLMHLRRFVLVPMVQLVPDLIHPSFGVTMTELLGKIPEDEQVVIPVKEL